MRELNAPWAALPVEICKGSCPTIFLKPGSILRSETADEHLCAKSYAHKGKASDTIR
jgi:hypothetical protein